MSYIPQNLGPNVDPHTKTSFPIALESFTTQRISTHLGGISQPVFRPQPRQGQIVSIAVNTSTPNVTQTLMNLGTSMIYCAPSSKSHIPTQHYVSIPSPQPQFPPVYTSQPHIPQRMQTVITHTGEAQVGGSSLSHPPSTPTTSIETFQTGNNMGSTKTTFTILSIDPKLKDKERQRLSLSLPVTSGPNFRQNPANVSTPSTISSADCPASVLNPNSPIIQQPTSTASNIILASNSGTNKRGRGKRGPAIPKPLSVTDPKAGVSKRERKSRSQKVNKSPPTQKETNPRTTAGRKRSAKSVESLTPAPPAPLSKEMPQLVETNPNLTVMHNIPTTSMTTNSIFSQFNAQRRYSLPTNQFPGPATSTLSTTSAESPASTRYAVVSVTTQPNSVNTVAPVRYQPRVRTPIIIHKPSRSEDLQISNTSEHPKHQFPYTLVSKPSTLVSSVPIEALPQAQVLQRNGYIGHMSPDFNTKDGHSVINQYSSETFLDGDPLLNSPNNSPSQPTQIDKNSLPTTLTSSPEDLFTNTTSINSIIGNEVFQWNSSHEAPMSPEEELQLSLQSDYLDGFIVDMLPREDMSTLTFHQGSPVKSPKKMSRNSLSNSTIQNETSSLCSSIDSIIHDVVQSSNEQLEIQPGLKRATTSKQKKNLEVAPILSSTPATSTSLPSFSSSFKNYPGTLPIFPDTNSVKKNNVEKASKSKERKKISKGTELSINSNTPVEAKKAPRKRKNQTDNNRLPNCSRLSANKPVEVIDNIVNSGASGVISNTGCPNSDVIAEDSVMFSQSGTRVMVETVTLTHPTSPPSMQIELKPHSSSDILNSEKLTRNRDHTTATNMKSLAKRSPRKRNRSGGSISKTAPKAKVPKETSSPYLLAEKKKHFLESERQRKAILGLTSTMKPVMTIPEILKKESESVKFKSTPEKSEVQNQSEKPSRVVNSEDISIGKVIPTLELNDLKHSEEAQRDDLQVKVDSTLSGEHQPKVESIEIKEPESSSINVNERVTEEIEDTKVISVELVIKNGLSQVKQAKTRVRNFSSKDGVPEMKQKRTPRKSTPVADQKGKTRASVSKNIAVPEKNPTVENHVCVDQDIEELFKSLQLEEDELAKSEISKTRKPSLQENEHSDFQSPKDVDVHQSFSKLDDDPDKLNEVTSKRISYTEEELNNLYSPGMFIIHRKEYDSLPEIATIWKINLEADGHISLLGHDAYTRPGTNKLFHCYKYKTDNKVTKTKRIDFSVPFAGPKLLFTEYLPIFITRAVETEEVSIVKYYNESRVTPYLNDINNFMEWFKLSFQYYLQGILYQSADPNFMNNFVFSSVEVGEDSLLAYIRTGFSYIEEALKEHLRPYIGSKYCTSEPIKAAMKYPKLVLKGSNCVDKSRGCDMCPEKKKSVRVCSFGCTTYNRLTFSSNEGPEEEQQLEIDNDKKLQLCFSCSNLLRNFHNLFHHSIHIYYCCYYRYKSALSTLLSPTAVVEVSSWVDCVMSDTDWITKMELDFAIVLAQSKKDAETRLVDSGNQIPSNYKPSLTDVGNEIKVEANEEKTPVAPEDLINEAEIALDTVTESLNN